MNWTENDLNELETLRRERHTVPEIAELMSLSTTQVNNALDRYSLRNLKIEKKKRHSHNDVLPEVKNYLDDARKVCRETFNIFKSKKYTGHYGVNKQNEDQVLLWSDMHSGMVNHAPITGELTYNPEIEEQELLELRDGVYRFHSLFKPSYNIERLHIFSLGDNITNDRIFKGQLFEIASCVGRQIVSYVNYKSSFINQMLKIYPEIIDIEIVGNHGRTTQERIAEPVENNFEWLGAQILKERFAGNKRVQIIVPNDYAYSAVVKGHKYLLMHGHFIRGSSSNTLERAAEKITLLLGKDFHDATCIGHFHSINEKEINTDSVLLVNGCWIKKDSWAYYTLKKESSAKQFFFNVSDRSSMHNIQRLNLRWSLDKK